jgi:hypothetical protein
MTMLHKERWIFDPKRGLARDTKNPQQSDQDLRTFSVGHQQVVDVVDVEDDIAVVPTKKKMRRAGAGKSKRKASVVSVDDETNALGDEVPAPEKKPRKGRTRNNEITTGDIFSDDIHTDYQLDDIDSVRNHRRSLPPPPPKVPLPNVPPSRAPPQITPEDINLMLDAKLEQMLSVIAKNQTAMEKTFAKALEEQRREFVAAQKNSSTPSTTQHSYSPLNLLTSPSSMPGMISIVLFITYYD